MITAASAPRIAEEWQLTAVGGLDVLLLAALTALAAGGVIWTWLTLDPKLPLRVRVELTALRAAALALGVALLLQPTLRLLEMKPIRPRLAILVDVSGSMRGGGAQSRLAEVRGLLEAAAPALERLASSTEIRWYAFAEDLSPAADVQSALATDTATRATDLGRALEKLASQARDEAWNAVLVIGDGADTAARRTAAGGSRDVKFAKKLGVPVNTVAITRAKRQRDLAIAAVKADPFAFARSDTPITVSLTSTGLAEKKMEVTLSQGGSVMQARTVELVGGAAETVFSVRPFRLGRNVLTVTTAIPPGDEIPENNTAHVAFEVLRDKVRVLHIAGRPSWDQRFLRDTLSAWPHIDLVSFYVLRTPFQSTTLGSDGMTLIPFPTADLFERHLDEFDILIFQDLDPAGIGVDRYLEKIAGYVRGGGGLALLGGAEAFGPSAMARPPFSEILPVAIPSTGRTATVDANAVRVALTEAGKRHPVTRLLEDEAQNVARWDSLERLDGMVRVAGVRDQGVVLAAPANDPGDRASAPLISVREAGDGRVVAIATDSLWRWRFSGPLLGGSADAYPDLWRRVVDWLSRDPRLDRLRVEVTPATPRPDEPISLRVELVDESFRAVPHAKLVADIGWSDATGVARSAQIPVSLDADGRFLREWRPVASGPHEVRVSAAGLPSAEASFLVASRDVELQHLEPDIGFLRGIAESTGGRFGVDAVDFDHLERADTPTREILSRKDSPLWSHPAAFLLLFAALLGEWLLRRRIGLN
ncbi:MAG: VWA domain-containing protein [Proteobacteria bacterium]|jgi:hypothetical protein|nr:VWA domain-containing protein [Pseudomonadota bacterium]